MGMKNSTTKNDDNNNNVANNEDFETPPPKITSINSYSPRNRPSTASGSGRTLFSSSAMKLSPGNRGVGVQSGRSSSMNMNMMHQSNNSNHNNTSVRSGSASG